MQLKEIIDSNEWLSVKFTLLELYPEEEKNLNGYRDVFNRLKVMIPKTSNVSLTVANQEDDFDGTEYVHVSGFYVDPTKSPDGYTGSLAIEFTPWNEWLGMEVSKDSLAEFSEFEIIAHSLFEMTFVGFEEISIQTKMDEINASTEEVKNMTGEERKEKLTSLEDLLKV
jgi:hypothetical protein